MKMHRQWLAYEIEADTYSDGLTGCVDDDVEIQEANRERADMCFRGSYEMPGPVVPQRQASQEKVDEASRWLQKRAKRYSESIAATDAASFSEPLEQRVASFACDMRSAEGFDRKWIRGQIDEAIRLERETARLQPDDETLAEIIQSMKEMQ